MFALLDENNAVTKVGELATLFPDTSSPNASFAQEQGALEVVEGEQKDQRFYWVTFSHYEVADGVVTRTYTNTPKALEDVTNEDASVTQGLKSQWIAQNKANANSLLASTDWMVIRKAERDVAISSDVVTARATIIADCTAKEASITAATTIEELIAVVAPVTIGQL